VSERINRKTKATGGGGGGEANTAQNFGVGGVGVFHSKSGVALRFKNINAGSNKVSVTDDTTNREVDIDVVPGNIQVTDLGGVAGLGINGVVGTSNSGELETIPGFSRTNPDGGLNISLNSTPDNSGGRTSLFLQTNYDPPSSASNDYLGQVGFRQNIDVASSGFDLATNSAVRVLDLSQVHSGTSDVGSLQGAVYGVTFGNGTDAVATPGITGYGAFATVSPAATVSSFLQGFSCGYTLQSGAVLTGFANIFSDSTTVTDALTNGYVSFSASPNLPGGLATGTSYTGVSLAATIGDLQGNAGWSGLTMFTQLGDVASGSVQGLVIAPTVGDLGAGSFATGISVNPTIAALDSNMQGIRVSPTITAGSGNYSGVQLDGSNVGVSGSVVGLQIQNHEVAIDSQGRHTLNSNFQVPSGVGQVAGNIVGGTLTLGANETVTGTDVLANNFAYSIDIGSGTTSYTKSLFGIASVGFVGQITGTASGGVDDVQFLLVGYAPNHDTGNIGTIYNINALAIPNFGGTGTVSNVVGYHFDLPFGPVGTDHWGVKVDAAVAYNHFEGSVSVGTASKKPANSSVGLELDSTTKAVLLSRMTEAQRDALTALDGMIIYNTTTNKFQGREGGNWVNLV